MNKAKERYNRNAWLYDFLNWFSERFVFARYRREIIPKLKGKILEVGVGTGKNLPFYSNEAEVTAVDFSSKMLARAEKKLMRLGKSNIILKEADVENLPFDGNTFDFVVTTCVFCSVPNPVQGFFEVKRVLKNKGQAIFLEHVRAKNKLLGKLQDILNPLTVKIFGFNINRKTWENIEKSGLIISEDRKLGGDDILRLFICEKNYDE